MPSELIDKIDALAQRMGLQRSGAIRYVMARAVDEPSLRAALIEEMTSFRAALSERANNVYRRVQEILYEEFTIRSREPAREPSTLPALPARGESDIVEGEIVPMEGLGLGRVKKGKRRGRL